MKCQLEQRNLLYPERFVDSFDKQIDVIDEFEKGVRRPMELTEQERESVLRFENELGERMEKISDITIQKASFYVAYFLTPQGKRDFEETIGIVLSDNVCDEQIVKTIFEHRKSLQDAEYEKIKKIAGRSMNYYDEQLFRQISDLRDHDGVIDVQGIGTPCVCDVLLTPEKSAGKIAELIAFKSYAKNIASSLNDESREDRAKKKIIDLYRRKYNQMMTEQFFDNALVARMVEIVGEDQLTDEEKELLKMQKGMKDVEKNLSRRDRFIHGADVRYKDGERVQVSEGLKKFAEEIALEWERNEAEKEASVREKGYDPAKIFAKNITTEQVASLENELLNKYELKSVYESETYDEKRSGSAPDGKWQFVAKDSYKSMEIKGMQKVIKSDTKKKDIYSTITVALGHEWGHVFQTINSEKIPLRMFKKVKGDRSSVFAEGGAMMLQDHIAREIFGTGAVGHPHYVRAMVKKMEGGNYIDCVKAFYDSSMRALRRKKDMDHMSLDEFKKQSDNELRLAINRIKRLFRHGADFSSTSGVLTKSKDTAYLEQVMLAQKLQERGLEKYAFFSGMNFSTLTTLLELGFLNKEEIQIPQLHVFSIWDRIKQSYLLENQNDSEQHVPKKMSAQ